MVSVFVAREPIGRILAGDAWVNKYYPGLKRNGSSTEEMWWKFANADKITDNYALRILAGNGCCSGNNTSREHLETAKDVVKRFTFVLDIECLNEGMVALADILDLPINRTAMKPAVRHGSSRDRIPHEKVYEHLVQKNRLDIELYEWSKTLSLVNCTALPR